MRTALTIAGSDSGGGAGIQADLKSFAAVGVHGTSVLTCVTAQNTRAVTSIFPLPAPEIRAQLRAVLDDFEVRGAKTGMLYSAEIVGAVADELRHTDFPLVVDPVMVATVGARLEQDDFKDALVTRLLPQAQLLTPNRREAERIAGFPIRDLEDMEKAARALRSLGPHAVLVKGGHVAGELVDVLFDGTRMRRLRSFRYPKELHGAGCTLAASVAAYLAQGESLVQAVESARRRVASGFLESYRAGHGVEIINSQVRPHRYEVWLAVTRSAAALSTAVPARLRPRGGLEMTYALPGAMSAGDFCVWRERDGPAGFGAPLETASALLAVLHVNPTLRASARFKYPPKNAKPLPSDRVVVATLARGRSRGGDRDEGWMERAIVEAGTAPDVLVDARNGGSGTTMRVLGENPERVVTKVRRLLRGGGR
ncbi:MAG TPA: bifunctional hydroxymethylpyrimidine kinase/phosphomethylpyrimidine kinase [Thermoplasmata archaeon]|nr:bifunctional hydroxymethylpyrimidine kinase/phosphomethylpyrimidine kinase [Thermoplasmata archaeon]